MLTINEVSYFIGNKQLYDKYEFVEGDTLDEIQGQLSEEGIDIGQIYDIDEFM